MEFAHLTGVEKAAVLALALPPEASKDLLSRLDDVEVERVMAMIARFDEVPGTVRDQVLSEFRDAVEKHRESLIGGRGRAAALARSALDAERAQRIARCIGRDETRIDRVLARLDPGFVARTLAGEHPQTVALVLAQLSEDRAAAIVASLPQGFGTDVMVRLAGLDAVPADVLAELEEDVAELFDAGQGPAAPVGGASVAARILNRVPRAAGSMILEAVEDTDPCLAQQIRRRMLRFDDLHRLDRRDFQVLLREVSIEDLVLALKTAGEAIRAKVFDNVSNRAAEQIREEAELLGAVRRSDVERVQERIVEIARRLDDEGRIALDPDEKVDGVV